MSFDPSQEDAKQAKHLETENSILAKLVKTKNEAKLKAEIQEARTNFKHSSPIKTDSLSKKLQYLNGLKKGVFVIRNDLIYKVDKVNNKTRNRITLNFIRVCNCWVGVTQSNIMREKIEKFNNKVYCSQHLKLLKLYPSINGTTIRLCKTPGCKKIRQYGEFKSFCKNCFKAMNQSSC